MVSLSRLELLTTKFENIKMREEETIEESIEEFYVAMWYSQWGIRAWLEDARGEARKEDLEIFAEEIYLQGDGY